MKHIRYYIMALLALPLMASCGEDDYSAPTPAGNSSDELYGSCCSCMDG